MSRPHPPPRHRNGFVGLTGFGSYFLFKGSTVQVLLIYLASLCNPLLPRGSPAKQGNAAKSRGWGRLLFSLSFQLCRGAAGACPILPPSSSVVDGASLALIGTVPKRAAVCMPLCVALGEHPLHLFTPRPSNFSFWCGLPLPFWQVF